jgi:hypothetical protein
MADSAAFAAVSTQIEQRTDLDRLESRGTVRLALQKAGLDAASVTPRQMGVVLERVLPGELAGRGVADADGLCRNLASIVSALPEEAAGDTPDMVFQRLGSSA